MGAGGDAETNPNTNNNNSSRSAGMKALKLRPFNEDKDDLDAYLIRFERACRPFEVHQEHKSTQWLGYYRVKPWMFNNDSQTTRLMIMMC